MAIIYSPNKSYNGETASVQFRNGVGETNNPYLINYLKQKGYTVEEKKNLVDNEIENLKKRAKELGVTFKNNISKEKLKERVEEAEKLLVPSKQEPVTQTEKIDTETDNTEEIDPFEDNNGDANDNQ